MTEHPCRNMILIVDGDLGNLATLAVTLRAYYRVETASTASAGLQRLAEFAPDLVVLDPRLPDLDGESFLQGLRAHFPICPVIVLTALERPDAAETLMALRIDGFFRKPVLLHTLLESAGALLARKGPRPPSLQPYSRHMSKAIDYVSRQYSHPLTIKTLAGAIGVSSSHLAQMFKAALGLTIKEYLAKVRVEAAKRLLVDTDQKLDLIAELVGFCDASHLSRVFKHHEGHPPGRYRRALPYRPDMTA